MSKKISHEKQKAIWEEEHRNPYVLLPMDSSKPSNSVISFWEWLKNKKGKELNLRALEMGCGKGRNSIWFAQQGINMSAFDFSEVAIKEARERAKLAGVLEKVDFFIHDAAEPWPFDQGSFDFVVDIFATTDIECFSRRSLAQQECLRVLKPKGYFFLYTLSTDDEFHKEMLDQSPGEEKNSFLHPTTGKFEKVFEREEIIDSYKKLKLIEEKYIEKTATFFGRDYKCKHFWMIFQKP